MKRIHLLIIAVGVRSKLLFLFVLFITQNIFSLTYNVTVPTGTKACYFAGEIIGWSHQAMTKVDETHYTISFANANPTQPYKYCSGPDWGYEELDAAGVPIANRTYNVADVVIKWRAVYEPGAVVTQINYNRHYNQPWP